MSQLIVFLLLILVTIPFSWSADEISTADKKEIIKILFERIAASPEGNLPQTILLSPGFDSSILPEISGIDFKKLKYGEEEQTPEYFSFHFSQKNEQDVIVGILRGNRCLQEGQTFKVHYIEDSWTLEPYGYSHSGSISGPCPACKIETVSEKIVGVLDNFYSQIKPQDNSLQLKGKVQSVECEPIESMMHCVAKVDFTINNTAESPIIVIKQSGYYQYRPSSRSLALTRENLNSNGAVYWDYFGESESTSEEYSQLAYLLDVTVPPPDYTNIINPGEFVSWTTSLGFRFNEENTCDMGLSGSVEIGWKSIEKLQSPLWLKVGFEIWPFNVENFKKGLGLSLRKRWKGYGDLWGPEEPRGKYWQVFLFSEPIKVSFL